MTELSFAKSFLSTLDQRPSKISPDHIEEPRNYPAQNAYILPKMPHPLPKTPGSSTTNTTSLNTYTIHLISIRNPPISLSLPSLPPTTSILELKTTLSASESIPIAKLKILWKKRPVSDSKILKELDEDGNGKGELEFGVMVMGGAASIIPKETAGTTTSPGEKEDVEMQDADTAAKIAAPAAQGTSGLEVIESSQFWSDLEGYLMQRVRDEERSKKLLRVFREGFESRRSEL